MREKEAKKKERWERNNLGHPSGASKFQANEGKSSQKLCMVAIIELLGLKY